mgnify:CR=1 FL=1
MKMVVRMERPIRVTRDWRQCCTGSDFIMMVIAFVVLFEGFVSVLSVVVCPTVENSDKHHPRNNAIHKNTNKAPQTSKITAVKYTNELKLRRRQQ